VVRELISLPFNVARAAIELPRSMQRSIDEANELMSVSREQLEVIRRQADEALEQAERMNDLLARVVKLTEPIERAQRGGEYAAGALKRAIFGDQPISEGPDETGADILEAGAAEVIEEESAEDR
jgi:hypothetical protein